MRGACKGYAVDTDCVPACDLKGQVLDAHCLHCSPKNTKGIAAKEAAFSASSSGTTTSSSSIRIRVLPKTVVVSISIAGSEDSTSLSGT